MRNKWGKNSKQSLIRGFNYSDSAVPVAYVFGADMMIRHDLFQELNGFDPDFFMYSEEEELSWRIKNAGYDIINTPDAQIVHLEGASTKDSKGFNQRQFRLRMQGKLIYYRKCFGMAGMEEFYKARRTRFQRLLKLAKIQGKDPVNTQVSTMLECLDAEYQSYKASFIQ